MGRLISAFVLVSLVGAALAFNTIEHSQEVKNKISQSREFFSDALGIVLPDGYSDMINKMRMPGFRPEDQCLTLEVKEIRPVLERINNKHVATLSGTPVSTPDGSQMILLKDPNGILIEVMGS